MLGSVFRVLGRALSLHITQPAAHDGGRNKASVVVSRRAERTMQYYLRQPTPNCLSYANNAIVSLEHVQAGVGEVGGFNLDSTTTLRYHYHRRRR